MDKKELIKVTGRYSDDKGQEGILAELPEIKIIGDKNKYLANKWNKENPQSTSEIKLKKTNDGLKKEYNPGAGYLSAYDPVAALPVEAAVLNPTFKLAGKGFNLIKNAINNNKNNNLTENLLKFIDRKPFSISTNKIIKDKLKTNSEMILYDNFVKKGIDINRFNKEDLSKMLSKRYENLIKKSPEKFNFHYPDRSYLNKSTIESINKINDNKWNKNGYIKLNNEKNIYNKNAYKIDYLKNNNNNNEIQEKIYNKNNHGISERLYNASIDVAKQNKMDGIISGEILDSPQKTLNVLKKYQKEIVGKNGVYNYSNLNENLKKEFNKPVYLLKKPTNKYIPTKSIIFDPDIIKNNGEMKIRWKNKNIKK